jgi:hypothetical protein
MDVVAIDGRVAECGVVLDPSVCGADPGTIRNALIENLNVETTASHPLLPNDRIWAIRFRADGTVMIVLEMRNYGRSRFSAYFANVVSVRLGVPLRLIRIYYSASLPAVLETPSAPCAMHHRNDLGPVASAAADIIEVMCDELIERGRRAFAAVAGLRAEEIGFDQRTGRFFILDRRRSGNILEIATTIRVGSLLPMS